MISNQGTAPVETRLGERVPYYVDDIEPALEIAFTLFGNRGADNLNDHTSASQTRRSPPGDGLIHLPIFLRMEVLLAPCGRHGAKEKALKNSY